MNIDPSASGVFCTWLENLARNLRGSSVTDSGCFTSNNGSATSPLALHWNSTLNTNFANKTDGLSRTNRPIKNTQLLTEPRKTLIQNGQIQSKQICSTSKVTKVNETSNNEVASLDPAPPVCKLFAWCPVDIQPDGDCRLSGFYKLRPDGPFHFITTGPVTVVSSDGKSVWTEGDHLFYLHGGISWWIYGSTMDNPDCLQLPVQLQIAFSEGFPTRQWRSFTQGLHYIISNFKKPSAYRANVTTPVDENQPPTPVGGNSKHTLCPVVTIGSPVVDLDLPTPTYALNKEAREEQGDVSVISDSSVSSATDTALDSASVVAHQWSPVKSGSRIKNKHRHTESDARRGVSVPPSNSDLSSKSSSSSDTGSVVSRLKKHRKSPKKHKRDRNLVRSNSLAVPKIHISDSRSKRAKARRRHSSKAKNKEGIDDCFKLYTANGDTLDVRKLGQTRSGRWVIPRLDTRIGQIVHVDEEGSVHLTRGLNVQDQPSSGSHRKRSANH